MRERAASSSDNVACGRGERIIWLIPPFAEPFISGQDADLELAALMNAEDLLKGLSGLC